MTTQINWLRQDEEIIHESQPYWFAPMGSAIFLVLIPPLIFFVPFIWLKYRNAMYYVTNQRLVRKTGIVNPNIEYFEISDIDYISSGSNLAEQLFSAGHIEFQLGKEKETTQKFTGIPDYMEMYNTIQNTRTD